MQHRHGFVDLFVLRAEIGAGNYVLHKTDSYVAEVLTGPIQLPKTVMVNQRWGDGQFFKMDVAVQRFPDERYLLVSVPFGQGTKAGDSYASASLAVALAAAKLALVYPDVVAEQKFEGVVPEPKQMVWLPPSPLASRVLPEVGPERVRQDLAAIEAAIEGLSDAERGRFRLASRWYVRGLSADNAIDRLLYWFFSLEVHPAHGTTDIPGSVVTYLHQQVYPDVDRKAIKDRTRIGHITGRRAEIVHNGQAFVPIQDEIPFGNDVEQLGALVLVCLRTLAGVPHDGLLDPWVKPQASRPSAVQPSTASEH